MPTYDYICDACGHEFELFQSMSDSAKRKCPQCGRHKLRRLIGTGAGVIFKGSGFYETDYRSNSYNKAAEADKNPTSDTKESSDTKKTDTKVKADKGSTTETKPTTDAKKSK